MVERGNQWSASALTKAILGLPVKQQVRGFRCTTDGTVDLVDHRGSVKTGFPVLAGVDNDIRVSEITASSAGDVWLYGTQDGGEFGAYVSGGEDGNDEMATVGTASRSYEMRDITDSAFQELPAKLGTGTLVNGSSDEVDANDAVGRVWSGENYVQFAGNAIYSLRAVADLDTTSATRTTLTFLFPDGYTAGNWFNTVGAGSARLYLNGGPTNALLTLTDEATGAGTALSVPTPGTWMGLRIHIDWDHNGTDIPRFTVEGTANLGPVSWTTIGFKDYPTACRRVAGSTMTNVGYNVSSSLQSLVADNDGVPVLAFDPSDHVSGLTWVDPVSGATCELLNPAGPGLKAELIDYSRTATNGSGMFLQFPEESKPVVTKNSGGWSFLWVGTIHAWIAWAKVWSAESASNHGVALSCNPTTDGMLHVRFGDAATGSGLSSAAVHMGELIAILVIVDGDNQQVRFHSSEQPGAPLTAAIDQAIGDLSYNPPRVGSQAYAVLAGGPMSTAYTKDYSYAVTSRDAELIVQDAIKLENLR